MLRKLLGLGGQSPARDVGVRRGGSSNRKSPSGRGPGKDEAEADRARALENTEVRESKFDFPTTRMSMVDRLESHRKGSLFKYAVISSAPPKNRGSILDRLRTYQPPNDQTNVRLDDLPPLLLSDEYTCVNLSQAIDGKNPGLKKPFCMISDIFIHYVPLDTFLSTQSTVEVMLNDGRKMDEDVVRHASFSSNAGYNVLMTLDYCIETKDINLLNLTFSRHVSKFKKGKSWAMCKVLIGIDFFDYAKRSNIQETLAVCQFAETDLAQFMTDPRGTDQVITSEGLRQMRETFASGDIENLTKPRSDQKSMGTAMTILGNGGDLGDCEPEEVIEAIKEKALQEQRIKAQQMVIRPRKSSMKPTSQAKVINDSPAEESEDVQHTDDGLSDMREIEVDESASNVGQDDHDDDLFDHDDKFVSQLQKGSGVRFQED
jgi:hypothetical protein